MIKITKYEVISPIFTYHMGDIVLGVNTQNGYDIRLFNGEYSKEYVYENPNKWKLIVGGYHNWWNKHLKVVGEDFVKNKKELKEYINDKNNYKINV